MKDLLEAGVHFGHQTKRWNPKMKEYIFGERNGIYILDLGKTVKLFKEAEEFVSKLANEGRTWTLHGHLCDQRCSAGRHMSGPDSSKSGHPGHDHGAHDHGHG